MKGHELQDKFHEKHPEKLILSTEAKKSGKIILKILKKSPKGMQRVRTVGHRAAEVGQLDPRVALRLGHYTEFAPLDQRMGGLESL